VAVVVEPTAKVELLVSYVPVAKAEPGSGHLERGG